MKALGWTFTWNSSFVGSVWCLLHVSYGSWYSLGVTFQQDWYFSMPMCHCQEVQRWCGCWLFRQQGQELWLWKPGRMVTLIPNHNYRFCLRLRHSGHFYGGNNCLLCKLLRVCKQGHKRKEKAHRLSENGLFLSKDNWSSHYSSLWLPLNYFARDTVIICP